MKTILCCSLVAFLLGDAATVVAGDIDSQTTAEALIQRRRIFTIDLHRTGRLIRDADGRSIPTSDNHAIRELAKVFTGLTMQAPAGGNPWSSGNDYSVPMVMQMVLPNIRRFVADATARPIGFLS